MRWVSFACALFLFSCSGGSSSGSDPDGGVPPVSGLDPTFGGDGVVTVGFEGGIAGLMRVARQSDGKIVAVGGTKESVLIVRALSDGSLDPDFGDDGVVQLPFGVPTNGVQVGFGCVIQPDDAIVVAAPVLGTYGSLMGVGVVARLTPDGSLDSTFGSGGYMVSDTGTTATSLALADSGAIYVGGAGSVTRLLSDGTVDTTFGDDTQVAPTLGRILELAVLPDQSVLAVGNRHIARLTSAGALDASFGVDGIVEVPSTGSGDALYSLALADDGKFLVGGAFTPSTGGNASMWLGRYLADGTPDTSFAGGAVGDPEAGGQAFGVGFDPSGRIVASGFTQIGEVYGRSARFDADGNLDTSFGQGGVGAHFYHVLFSNIVFEPDGAFTAVGSGLASLGDLGSGFAPVLTRTDANGNADTAFGASGEVMFRAGGSFDRAQAVAVQPDGKVLVGGWAYDSGGVGVVRLDENGELDTTFAEEGSLLRSDNLSYVSSLAADENGRVLVSGLSAGRDFPGFVVERYLESGELDATFGTEGVAGGLLVGDLEATGFSMTVASDGTIYLVGQTDVDETTTEFGVLALSADGDRMSSFGADGAATSAFGMGRSTGTHVALQPDGHVVVLGLGSNQVTLVRFSASGVLDDGFGPIVVSDATGALPLGLAVQPDGGIIAVAGDTAGNLTIMRLTSSGQPDPSFGSSGVVTETFGGNDYYGLYVSVGLAVLPDGGIALGLASARDDGLVETGMLLRYLSDGSPDLDFAPGGQQEVALGGGSTAFHAMALDESGRLVVVGRTWTANEGSEFLAMRLNL